MRSKKREESTFKFFNKQISARCKKILIQKSYLTIVLFIITLATFLMSIYIQPEYLTYQEKSNLDYNVYLKENTYYEKPYLEKNMQYIASLIDYIDVNFKYQFDINENINYEYKYYVEADVMVFEKGKQKNVIFQKKEKILEDVIKNEQNSSNFFIAKNIKIDYAKYNNLVKEFKTEYSIAAQSNVKFTLHVDVNGKQNGTDQPIKVNNNMEISIPLTEQMVNINMEYKEINDNSKIGQSNKLDINKILRNISILFAGLFALMIMNVINFVSRSNGEKTYYQKRVEKILRDYDRVVVKLKKAINISENEEIIDVVNFEELLDLSDRLCKSILFMETDEEEKGWFIVKNDREIYRYVIEENSLVVENKQWINI